MLHLTVELSDISFEECSKDEFSGVRKLRDNFEIVSPEIESMVAQAWKIDGVIGSRMTGCGLGACTISLVREEVIDTFIEQVGAVYESQTGIKPEFYIAVIGDSACKLK